MTSLALSTRWNTFRHESGEDMIQEIMTLGFEGVELGYDLTADLVSGVMRMVEQNATKVVSVHNFCPVPIGAPYGHPELFELASRNRRIRDNAVQHTLRTVRFAAEMGADAVVVHCGNVNVTPSTRALVSLCEQGKQHSDKFEKLKMKLMLRRDRNVRKYLDQLDAALEEMLPVLEDTGVRLGIENLPAWESIPTEQELIAILQHFDSPYLRSWHDIGHGRIRQNLGFISQHHWLDKLKAYTAGMHVHDVQPPARDHLMPPTGEIDFASFDQFVENDTVVVLEPAPGTPVQDVVEGKRIIMEQWAPMKEEG